MSIRGRVIAQEGARTGLVIHGVMTALVSAALPVRVARLAWSGARQAGTVSISGR